MMPPLSGEPPPQAPEGGRPEALTPIPGRIHSAATSGPPESDHEAAVEAFLDTLARVAQAVAARTVRKETGKPKP